MTAQLIKAVSSIPWADNVAEFAKLSAEHSRIDAACRRLAVWSKELETSEGSNPAISFVRAMQIAAHQSVAALSVGLYKAAAGSIRGIVENALYYTYFRSHPAELTSLVRNTGYYLSKADALSFHKEHTPKFKQIQDSFGLLGRIEEWYSEISAVIHGQIPGKWVEQTALSDVKTNPTTLNLAVDALCEAEWIVHGLLLTTVGRELWDGFAHAAKKALLSGLTGNIKDALSLDKH